MEERIENILSRHYVDYHAARTPEDMQKVVDTNIQAILTAVAESLPSAVDEDGSQGKWVNGWNDYREYMLAQLGKEE